VTLTHLGGKHEHEPTRSIPRRGSLVSSFLACDRCRQRRRLADRRLKPAPVELAARLEQHEDRLRRLEEQARQDSRTSSRPPSQDPPKTRAQRRAEARAKAKELMRREGERRTAQSGHQGAGRELMPSDQVDEIVEHYPQACGGCGRQFDGGQRRPGGRFGRHQICELPPISVIVTEHRTHQLRCRHCRARTSARLPGLIAASRLGRGCRRRW